MNSARRVSSAVRGLPLSVQLSLGMWALSRRCWRDTAMTLPIDGRAPRRVTAADSERVAQRAAARGTLGACLARRLCARARHKSSLRSRGLRGTQPRRASPPFRCAYVLFKIHIIKGAFQRTCSGPWGKYNKDDNMSASPLRKTMAANFDAPTLHRMVRETPVEPSAAEGLQMYAQHGDDVRAGAFRTVHAATPVNDGAINVDLKPFDPCSRPVRA